MAIEPAMLIIVTLHLDPDRKAGTDQRLFQPTVLTPAHDRLDQFDQRIVGMRRARHLPQGADQGLRNIGGKGRDTARRAPPRFGDRDFGADRIGARRNIGEILLDQRTQFGLIEVASYDQCGGIRPIIGLMKGERIFEARRVQLFNRANAGAAMGQEVIAVLDRHDPAEAAIGRCKDARAQFFLHDIALGFEHLVIHYGKGHALPVRPQHSFQIFGGHRLVIIGAVHRVGGIARAAHIGGQTVDHIVGHVDGLAAEDVLEEMRETCAPFGIELRSDAVPHGGGDGGGRIVMHRDDLQAVVQMPFGVSDFGGSQCNRFIGVRRRTYAHGPKQKGSGGKAKGHMRKRPGFSLSWHRAWHEGRGRFSVNG